VACMKIINSFFLTEQTRKKKDRLAFLQELSC